MAQAAAQRSGLPGGEFPIVDLRTGQATYAMLEWMLQTYSKLGGSAVALKDTVYFVTNGAGAVTGYTPQATSPQMVVQLGQIMGASPVVIVAGARPRTWAAPSNGTLLVEYGTVTLKRGGVGGKAGGPSSASAIPVLKSDVVLVDWTADSASGAIGYLGIGIGGLEVQNVNAPALYFFPWN